MTTTSIQDQALSWFVRLSDADAPETAWVEFQTWLEADAAHAKAYDLIEQVWVALEDAPPIQGTVETGAANDAWPVAERAPRSAARAYRRWLTPVMGLAAAAVLVVGLWPEITGTGRFQTFATDDAVREVVLPDGSHLSMNRHSALKARIGSRDREVLLSDGEVAFDVRHDAARPFVVSTDDHAVRVLGTAFNVLSHEDRFSVGVRRGLVAVSGDGVAGDLRLSMGQRIDQAGTAKAVVTSVDPDQASAWRQGVLIYREADLGAVADDLSRYLNKPVSVMASARALRFTGALRIGDEATMLEQLQDFVPITVNRANDGIRLTARDGG